MAGPFSPTPQPEIADTRLQAQSPTAAGAGVAQAVVQGLGSVVQANTKLQIKQEQEEVKGQLSAVSEALEIFRSGDARRVKTLEDSAMAGNPASRAALQELNTIRAASEAGKIPSTEVAIRTRNILKNAINEAPEFADELRAAARQAIGFSPEAEAVNRLMREPTAGKLTGAQKAVQEFNQDVTSVMLSFNVDQDTATNMVQAQRQTAFKATTAKENMTVGQYTTQKAATVATEGMNLVAQQYMGRIVQLAKANPQGVVNTQDAKAQLGLMIETLKQQSLAGVTDSKQRGDLLRELDVRRQSLEKWTDQIISMKGRQTEVFDSMVAMAKSNAVLTVPEIAIFAGLSDPSQMLDYMDLIAKSGGDTKLLEKMGMGAGTSFFLQLGQGTPVDQVYRNSYQKFLQGQAPTDDVEANLHAHFAQRGMKQKDVQNTTMKENFSKIVATNGEFTAITALDDGQVIANAQKNRDFAASAVNVMATQLESANARINEVRGAFNLTFDNNGNITIDQSQRPAPAALGGGGAESAAFTAISEAVSRYNRINGINNKWKNSGLSTQYEFQAPEQAAPAQEQQPTSNFTVDITDQAPEGFNLGDGVYQDANGNRIEVRGGRVFTTGE